MEQNPRDEARRLIHSYFTQFTIGCDRIVCTNPNCCSCPEFSYHFGDANDAAVLAIDFTYKHALEPRICTGLNPLAVRPALKANLTAFDEIIRNLSREKAMDSGIAEVTLYEVISNSSLFPFILMTNDKKLTTRNLAIDDECVEDFVRVMERNVPLFHPSAQAFEAMLKKLITWEAPDTIFHVRGLILALSCEIFFSQKNFFTHVAAVITHIHKLQDNARLRFYKVLRKMPKTLSRILAMVQNNLTITLIHESRRRSWQELIDIARFFTDLRDLSSLQSAFPLPASAFSNDKFTELVSHTVSTPEVECVLSKYPAILNLNFRNELFHAYKERSKDNAMVQAVHQETHHMHPLLLRQLLFHGESDALMRRLTFSITIRRDHLLDDTIQQISHASPDLLSRKLMVTFEGEEGVDAGGVTREYFNLLMEQLFSPEYGMFKLVNDKYYWFNPSSLEPPILFQTLGTIVALAVYNDTILPIRFPLLLYKKLLAKKLKLSDVAELEPEVVRSLQSVLEMKERGENVADLMLTFSTTLEQFGEFVTVPLKLGGEDIEVTNSNASEYVQAYLQWFTNDSIQKQFTAFSNGFCRLCPRDLIKAFAPDELDTLVSGEEVLDWSELEKNAKYEEYRPNSRAVKWFWEIFWEMSNEDKKKFLFFTTGCDHAPLGGLSKVVITIQKVHDPTKLPVAHTCFSIFCLPDYPKKTQMRHNILVAISNTQGFGLR